MDDAPPPTVGEDGEGAAGDAMQLALAPAVFLLHFGAVYAMNALACNFGWSAARWQGIGAIVLGVALLTLLGAATLLWRLPAARAEPAEDVQDPYDPRERRHFLARASRMTAWLALAGMVLVALPVLLARNCG